MRAGRSLRPARRRGGACAAALLLALGAGAPAGAEEPQTRRPSHRDRAVTEADFERIAPASPGAQVERPATPKPSSPQPGLEGRAPAPHREELRRPRLGERVRQELAEEPSEATGSRVRFGDGELGRRPTTGRRPQGTLRRGAGATGPVPARPEPEVTPALRKLLEGEASLPLPELGEAAPARDGDEPPDAGRDPGRDPDE